MKKKSGHKPFTRRHSQRFLLSHPESDDVFEVYGESAFMESLESGCDNVTGIKLWEQRYEMKKPEPNKKCTKHRIVFLSTREKPHIAACLVCKSYKPNPHPKLTEEEIHALIDFVKIVSDKNFKKEPSISEKVAHVKSAKQTRNHDCHWPGCGKQVPPAMWGCIAHWKRLPKRLQDQIWAAYKPGQEETLTPSKEYVKVAREVQDWIDSQELL